MFMFGNTTVFDWLGWDNQSSCVIDYFNVNGAGENRNLGFTIIPLHIWKHIGFSIREFGYQNKRVFVGLGIFSIFWDIKS